MHFGIVTLFKEAFVALDYGVIGRARKQGIIGIDFWDPRDYTHDKHRSVDDRPYGGGPGMVMMAAPMQSAIHAAKTLLNEAKVIHLSPQGKRLDQATVRTLAKHGQLILVTSRYEGLDERLIESEIDEEWSIGDYVLSGGEIPAMVFIDAITRLLPGTLGDEDSAQQDSFTDGLLDCPHYTRPEEIAGMRVPDVLLSGNHAAIQRWRLKQALGRTWLRRRDLLENYPLTKDQKELLNEFIQERGV